MGVFDKRVVAGKEAKDQAEKARVAKEQAERNAQMRATQKKYDLEMLRKLKEKYPDA